MFNIIAQQGNLAYQGNYPALSAIIMLHITAIIIPYPPRYGK